MRVKKRDGRIQEFNINKIKLTLERVSDDTGQPLTGSDIERLTKAIQDELYGYGKELLDASQIRKVVVEQLNRVGFTRIAKAYDKFGKRYE